MGSIWSKKADEKIDGPKCAYVPSEKRKCRDLFCCILFLVYWLGMLIVAMVGMKSGKPLTLIYGRDYLSNVCGDVNQTHAKYTVYPRLGDDMMTAAINKVPLQDMEFFGVCVSACPLAGEEVCTYDNSTCWTIPQDTKNLFFRCLPLNAANETILAQECIDPPLADPQCTFDKFAMSQCDQVCKTKRVKKNVWEIEETSPNPLIEQMQSSLATIGRLVSDMNAAKLLIFVAGGLGSLLFGVVWLGLLQYFAGLVVWLTCFLVIILLIFASLFCSVRGGIITSAMIESVLEQSKALADAQNMTISSTVDQAMVASQQLTLAGDESTIQQFKYGAYLMWIFTGGVFLVLIAMRKRIKIAIAIIQETSRAIQKMPMLLLWPIVPTVLFILLVLYSAGIAAYLISSGDLTEVVTDAAGNIATVSNSTIDTSSVNQIQPKTMQQILLAYHFFGFLWTNQLILAISTCTIAGSIGQYYWSVLDGDGDRQLECKFPILRSLKNVVYFSLGSLCFGSFIIAVVQFLRFCLEYVDRNTKQLQQGNAFVKVAIKIIRCCIWCFEKILKFLSKNAYILIAIKGDSFCTASYQSFVLILKNFARVAIVNSISFFLLFLVKTTTTCLVGMFVFRTLSNATATEQLETVGGTEPVSSPMAPVVVSCILAWLVSTAFANIYDTAIDTILLCFCEDTNINGETASPYMSKELQSIMGGKIASNKIKVGSPTASKSPKSPESPNNTNQESNLSPNSPVKESVEN